jgi:sulfite exporter TauE/SafE
MYDWWIVISAGWSIGFLGSVHCIGMCGPLAMALPVRHDDQGKRWMGILAYNLGRAMTYAVLGVGVGVIGSTFNVWGLQQWVSIAAGGLMLMVALLHINVTGKIHWIVRVRGWIHNQLARVLVREHNAKTLFVAGNLNGLLPCGLVYVGLTAALAAGSAMQGAVLMFLFGIGTMPAMILAMALRNKPGIIFRRRINRAIPYIVSTMAVILILRGMELGIPYISPVKTMDSLSMPSCHQAK